MTGPRTAALVLAAGSGERFAGRGYKQFARIAGERLVDRVVRLRGARCDDVVVTLPVGVAWDGPAVTAAVAGGATRAASVRCGLDAIDGRADVIVVHDAAHPLVTSALVDAVVDAVAAGADGAVPALAPVEALKRVADGVVTASIDRTGVVFAQTPQAFRAHRLREAHAGEPDAVEDAELVVLAGGTVVTVPGDPLNVHVTTARELDMAARLLPLAEPAGGQRRQPRRTRRR